MGEGGLPAICPSGYLAECGDPAPWAPYIMSQCRHNQLGACCFPVQHMSSLSSSPHQRTQDIPVTAIPHKVISKYGKGKH